MGHLGGVRCASVFVGWGSVIRMKYGAKNPARTQSRVTFCLSKKMKMKNPTRRNKNIGTAKQGHKTQSKFQIPSSYYDSKIFYEKLGQTISVTREIGGQTVLFIVEKTKKNSCHACTIEDLERVLTAIPRNYIEGLTTFILRQPKAKEEIFSPVWGRLIYLYELGKRTLPAVILESVNYSKAITLNRKLSIEGQKEVLRLIADGHEIHEDKRQYTLKPGLEHVRNTQLYRTLLHEIGHYYHYITTEPDVYEKIGATEKEIFAHGFADQCRKALEDAEIIPFDRILTIENIKASKLDLSDFQIDIGFE
jgi:hypothetical protein